VNDLCPIAIGSDKENPVELTCADWQSCECKNSSVPTLVRSGLGGPRGGPWGVLVERGGEYEISIRRWPGYVLDVPLNGAYPEKKTFAGNLPAGKALPIAGATLTVAGRQLSVKTKATDAAAVFRVKLEAGQRTPIHGWFHDAAGNDLCGAYYASVRRL
jgi:hypothetical protein